MSGDLQNTDRGARSAAPVRLSGPAAEMMNLNEQLGLRNLPFGLATDAVAAGSSTGVTTKQLLYAHYKVFITDVWKRFSEWQHSVADAPLALLHPDQALLPIHKSGNLLAASTQLPLPMVSLLGR